MKEMKRRRAAGEESKKNLRENGERSVSRNWRGVKSRNVLSSEMSK
jgi:hypothetical protein